MCWTRLPKTPPESVMTVEIGCAIVLGVFAVLFWITGDV